MEKNDFYIKYGGNSQEIQCQRRDHAQAGGWCDSRLTGTKG
ncbi:MAG: hypothetical protein ACFFAS_00390 [Promethearchaeota archaeon]